MARKPRPYDIVDFKGVKVDRLTKRTILWIQDKVGFEVNLSQGSYNAGGVSASAGTHDGGGAVDFNINGLSRKQRIELVHAIKLAGGAAWYRPYAPGVWGEHVHAEFFGNAKMSAGGRQQLYAFDAGRDGLAGNRVDPTFRPSTPRRFSWKLNRPVRRRKLT